MDLSSVDSLLDDAQSKLDHFQQMLSRYTYNSNDEPGAGPQHDAAATAAATSSSGPHLPLTEEPLPSMQYSLPIMQQRPLPESRQQQQQQQQQRVAWAAAPVSEGSQQPPSASSLESYELMLQYRVAAATSEQLAAKVQVLQQQLADRARAEQQLTMDYHSRVSRLHDRVEKQGQQLKELYERDMQAAEELARHKAVVATAEQLAAKAQVLEVRRKGFDVGQRVSCSVASSSPIQIQLNAQSKSEEQLREEYQMRIRGLEERLAVQNKQAAQLRDRCLEAEEKMELAVERETAAQGQIERLEQVGRARSR